jgi:ribosomal protein S18 acetylase RimI-like enzyme
MSAMSIIVRPLSASDRPAIAAALGSDDAFSADEIAVALELVDHALEHGEVDYAVRIADLDGFPVAGYVCFGRTPMTESTFDLYWVVCHAAARGRGVAGALFQAMERELSARGAGGVRIETGEKEGHGAARRLYLRHGYAEAGRLPDFYQPGDGLLIYYKRL